MSHASARCHQSAGPNEWDLNLYKTELRQVPWKKGRSQYPRGLRHSSTAARVLRLWVRIPPGAWMFVCCEYCVFSGRGLCDGLITRPEESYRLWRVVVCDQGTSTTMRLKTATGLWKYNHNGLYRQENNKQQQPWKKDRLREMGRGKSGEYYIIQRSFCGYDQVVLLKRKSERVWLVLRCKIFF